MNRGLLNFLFSWKECANLLPFGYQITYWLGLELFSKIIACIEFQNAVSFELPQRKPPTNPFSRQKELDGL
ncbi:MAG: hypothetical protein ABIN01_21640 [Ferruginibacter sp.]